MRTGFLTFLRDRRGIAAIEMAFIMPFLLFLYFGLVDLTGMISVNRKTNYAASVIADLVTQNTSATITGTTINDYFKAAELVMKPEAAADVRFEIYQFRKVSGVITNQWSKKSTGGTTCGTPSTTGMDKLMVDNNDVIVGVVCMGFTPYIATFLGDSILGATSFNMSEQVALRPRMVSQMNCTGC